jgi:signal transduction histidine kinase
MLGSMRQEDRTVPGTHQPGYRPGQRTTAELVALVDEHRLLTGDAVDVRHEPELAEIDMRLGPMRAHIAYRVVQEALGNARKHATGARVVVSLEDDGTTLLLRIENDEPVEVAGGPDRGLRPSLGYGLEGMRDRLVAVGGSLRTGPRRTGGWSVNALLPHPPRQRPAAGRRAARRAGPPDAVVPRPGPRLDPEGALP